MKRHESASKMLNGEVSPSTQQRLRRRGATQIDVKTGDIFVILANEGRPMKSKMYMKVFKNAYEHHAQLFTDSDHKHPFGFISLSKCTLLVDEQARTISIASKNTNLKGLLLEAKTLEDIHSWAESLSPNLDLSCDSEYYSEPRSFANQLCVMS